MKSSATLQLDRDAVSREDLYRYKKETWTPSQDPQLSPETQLLTYRQKLINEVEALKSTVFDIQKVATEEGTVLVDVHGLDVEAESHVLSDLSTDLRVWSRLAARTGGVSTLPASWGRLRRGCRSGRRR